MLSKNYLYGILILRKIPHSLLPPLLLLLLLLPDHFTELLIVQLVIPTGVKLGEGHPNLVTNSVGPCLVHTLPLGIAGRMKWPLLTAFFLPLFLSALLLYSLLQN